MEVFEEKKGNFEKKVVDFRVRVNFVLIPCSEIENSKRKLYVR